MQQGLTLPGTSAAQKVRILLLILIEGYMCAHKGISARAHLRHLPALRDLRQVRTYDWAGYAYSFLLYQMRTAYRQVDPFTPISIAGLWRLIEVCFLCIAFLCSLF